MQVLINKDGSINRDYQQYVDFDEYHYNYGIYNPSRAPRFGLYDGPQPYCPSTGWKTYFNSKKRVPGNTVTATGQVSRFREPGDPFYTHSS